MKRSLVTTSTALRRLKAVLEKSNLVTNRTDRRLLRATRLEHSFDCDALNASKPRQFCQVDLSRDEPVIQCAKAIEAVPREVILGLLLHEIAHLLLGETGDKAEVHVDRLLFEFLPEAEYSYTDTYYLVPRVGGRMAHNIQTVGAEFAREVFLTSKDKKKRSREK